MCGVIGMNQRLKMHSHLSFEKRRSFEAFEKKGLLVHDVTLMRVHEQIMKNLYAYFELF